MGQKRDVITTTNQAGFCDDVIGTIADAVGTEETSEHARAGVHVPLVHPDTVFINKK